MALSRETQKLSHVMQNAGFTRATLADESGIDRIRIGNLIRGITYPTDEELAVLQQILEVTPEEMFDETVLDRETNKGRKIKGPTFASRLANVEKRLDSVESYVRKIH